LFPLLALEQIAGPVLLASAFRASAFRDEAMQDGQLCECLFKDEKNRELVMTHECWMLGKRLNGSFCAACGQHNGTCRNVNLEPAKQPSDAYCGDVVAKEVLTKEPPKDELAKMCGVDTNTLLFILQFHLGFNFRGNYVASLENSVVETHYKVQGGSMSDGLEVATVIKANVDSGIIGLDLVRVRLHDKDQTMQEIPKNWIVNSKGTACSDIIDLIEKQRNKIDQCLEAKVQGSECDEKLGHLNEFAQAFREQACPGSGPMQGVQQGAQQGTQQEAQQGAQQGAQ
jgi:hypothetical protein